MIGDLAAAGVIDFKAVASHIATAGEPPAAGAASQGLMMYCYSRLLCRMCHCTCLVALTVCGLDRPDDGMLPMAAMPVLWSVS